MLIPLVVRAPREEFVAALPGNAFGRERRGKYLLFPLERGDCMAVHSMLTGRFQYCPPEQKRRAKTASCSPWPTATSCAISTTGSWGRSTWCAAGDFSGVPRYLQMGPDPDEPELTEEAFRARLRRFRGQIKSVLLNETCVAAIGNAYADEILFAAAAPPLSQAHGAIAGGRGAALSGHPFGAERAAAIVTERMEKEGLPVEEYRDHLKVHRRGGQPCPNCGRPSRRSRPASGSRTSAATARREP